MFFKTLFLLNLGSAGATIRTVCVRTLPEVGGGKGEEEGNKKYLSLK